jgi:hypothetical protein
MSTRDLYEVRPYAEFHGTSFWGTKVVADYDDLVTLFGRPVSGGRRDGALWVFLDAKGRPVTLYDCGQHGSGPCGTAASPWHVGAREKAVSEDFGRWLHKVLGSKKGSVFGYLLAGAAGYGLARVVDNPEKVQAALRRAKGATKGSAKGAGPGWYALLYNYEKGNKDRRLKAFEGPFATKAEAEAKAKAEESVWFTEVERLDADPSTSGRLFGYLIAGAVGYGVARAVDNPEKVRAAAHAAAGEARRIGGAAKKVAGRAGGTRMSKRDAAMEAKKNATYAAARADAQKRANALGFDHGLEWNAVFGTWNIFMLPARQNRSGHELRAEVVMPENIEKTQPGHGYGRSGGLKGRRNGSWIPASGGTEPVFTAGSGKRLQYMFQPSTGRHAYLDVDSDIILDDEDARRHLDARSRGRSGGEGRTAGRKEHPSDEVGTLWNVRFVHKISPSDKDVKKDVFISPKAWATNITLAKALRENRILPVGGTIRAMAKSPDRVVVFPGGRSVWHSIIFTAK